MNVDGADVLLLPPGVEVRGLELHDRARAASWPLNESGAFVLRQSGSTLGAIAARLAERHALDPAEARRDVAAFAEGLNERLLLNVRLRGRGSLALLGFRLATIGLTPSVPARRLHVDSRTRLRAVATTARGLVGRAGRWAAAAGALGLPLGLTSALAVAAGVGGALVLHEAAHAAALRGVPCALVLQRGRTAILHPPLDRRRALVAIAGPALTTAVGVLAFVAAAAFAWEPLVLAAAPLGANALGFTVATSDGRSACGL